MSNQRITSHQSKQLPTACWSYGVTTSVHDNEQEHTTLVGDNDIGTSRRLEVYIYVYTVGLRKGERDQHRQTLHTLCENNPNRGVNRDKRIYTTRVRNEVPRPFYESSSERATINVPSYSVPTAGVLTAVEPPSSDASRLLGIYHPSPVRNR